MRRKRITTNTLQQPCAMEYEWVRVSAQSHDRTVVQFNITDDDGRLANPVIILQ